MYKLLFVLALVFLQSCSSDYHIRKFDGTTVLNYGPASKIKHYYQHRNLGENLEISVRPEKDSYYPLEEMAVLITVTNTSRTDSVRAKSPHGRVFFENEEGKRFNDGQFFGSGGCGVRLVRKDVMDRPVKRVGFPRVVLPPGESITERMVVKLMPRKRLFGELGSKAFGFPGLVPEGEYHILYKHSHREFSSDRLPKDITISAVNPSALRVVEGTGAAKEKAACIVNLTEEIKSAGGLFGKTKIGLSELLLFQSDCEQILTMQPVGLYADLLYGLNQLLETKIRRNTKN